MGLLQLQSSRSEIFSTEWDMLMGMGKWALSLHSKQLGSGMEGGKFKEILQNLGVYFIIIYFHSKYKYKYGSEVGGFGFLRMMITNLITTASVPSE